MTDRRSLAGGINAIPDTDPDVARAFIMQERKPAALEARELALVPERVHDVKSLAVERPRNKRRTKTAGVQPVGLIPVTVRLRPEIAGALKRASLERQLNGEEPFTQQEIVEQVLEPWLRGQGFLA